MYKLRNYNEEIVTHLLDSILDKFDNICKCEKCIFDIKAIALNSMPPRYIVTETGELFTKLYSKLDNQEIINATSKITQAIEIVSRNPQHQDNSH